jgi:proteic killer suppression protein
VIRSYGDRDTERLAAGERIKGWEPLKGDRKGQYSIRINGQWRICFEWPKTMPGPENVEIVDYR